MLVQRIVVSFEGPGAGVGPLNWGQQQVWAAMVESDSSMSMGGVVPVEDGRVTEDFAAELRFFMSRYAAMRTRLRFEPDGAVAQEVYSRGEATLEVHEPADSEDPAAVAEALAAAWRERKFDYADEWPLRMGVVRRDEKVTHVVVLMCHIAADLGGMAVMQRELAEPDPGPYEAPSPLDLARLQREPAMQRQTAAAMRYWEAHLRAVPPSLLGAPADNGEPRYCRVRWESSAMHLASAALSARLGADPAWILLAGIATAFDRVFPGRGPFVALGIISNRFRPALRDVVTPLTQDGLCVLDVTGATPQEAIARARTASMSASKYAYYDPAARADLTRRLNEERGVPLDLTVLYNDRRSPRPSTVDDSRPRETRILAEEPLPFLGPKLMVIVEDVPDVVRLMVDVDTRYLPLPDVRTLLHELESFTVTASGVG
ncbi:condensation domain-containing protein [Dactylosporangium sp. CA-233914]|uniref:condensation domain-containing protein n=1 Tax=Dactylosporangium sp. CA-233914 TaxID=3239934 RepID=UPI003D93F531